MEENSSEYKSSGSRRFKCALLIIGALSLGSCAPSCTEWAGKKREEIRERVELKKMEILQELQRMVTGGLIVGKTFPKKPASPMRQNPRKTPVRLRRC